MFAALFVRGEDERSARSAWGAAGVAGRSLSCLPDQPVRARWIFRSGVPPRPTAGCAPIGFAVGKFMACVWNPWDSSFTIIENVLQRTRTILRTVEGRTRQHPPSVPSRSALQKHLAAYCLAPSQGLNTFTAIVDLSRSNFSIARTPLFQLKSAM